MSLRTEKAWIFLCLVTLICFSFLAFRIASHKCPKTPCPEAQDASTTKDYIPKDSRVRHAVKVKPIIRPIIRPIEPAQQQEEGPDGAMVTVEAVEHDAIEEIEATPEEREKMHALVDKLMADVDMDLIATAVESDVSLMELAMGLLDDKEAAEHKLLGSKRAAYLKSIRDKDLNDMMGNPGNIFEEEWRMIQQDMGVTPEDHQ